MERRRRDLDTKYSFLTKSKKLNANKNIFKRAESSERYNIIAHSKEYSKYSQIQYI